MRKAILLFFAACSVGYTSMAQNTSSTRAQIEKNSEMMQKSIEDKDLETFGSFFSEDVMFKMSGQMPLSGNSAVIAAHEPMIEKEMKLKLNTEEVQDFGDFAYEIGNYELYTKEGQKVDHGHYGSLWKKTDGKWKIYRDMISSSAAVK